MMVIRLYSVDVSYPPGLEDLINAFKLCATVRLFLQVIILSYFSYFFYIHTKFCWCGCKKIGIGNRQLANKHFQTFISFLENFTNGNQDLLPDLDAGIFIDTDAMVLQDPAILWDRFFFIGQQKLVVKQTDFVFLHRSPPWPSPPLKHTTAETW